MTTAGVDEVGRGCLFGPVFAAAVVLSEVVREKGANYGYNAATNSYEVDMIKAGIIDPLKVTRTALENAVSVAALLLTTEAAVVDLPEEKADMHGGGMPGMGGMGGMDF